GGGNKIYIGLICIGRVLQGGPEVQGVCVFVDV
ncbi:MAG: hypothetical protein CI953_1414, partial [Methanohalophilus sp.]